MRISLLSIVPATVLLGLAGCADRADAPLGPPSPPLAALSDGAHRGNDHFFFLPPMVPNPSYHGTFDAGLAPVVDICEWTGSGCLLPAVATFTTTTGPGSETVRVADDHYIVNWHTDLFPLDPGKVYRVRVTVAGTELGYADVSVVGSGREVKNVNTNEYIALVDGRTLPIKFRIEVGAVFVIGPDGGTANAADGQVQLVVPPGALATEVGIVVRPVPDSDYPPGLGIIPGTVYDFQPSGLVFAQPVHLTIAYDPANVPTGVPEATLTFLAVTAGVWDELPGTTVDETANTISGPIDRFSKKGGAAAASITVSPGAASLIIGQTVQLTPAVTDATGHPMVRRVFWESGDVAVATVDGNGLVAAVGAGSATITARAGRNVAQAQIASVPVVSVTPATAALLVGETVQLTAAVTDVSGNPVALPVQWSSSAPAVATVNGAGLVMAVAAGNATITALAGGVPAVAQVQVSAPSPGFWTYVAPMPTARGRLAAAVANGILYTVGGSWSGNLRNLEAYNPGTNTWAVRAYMPTQREAMSAASFNGIIYVVGGGPSIYSPALGTLEAYDPATNTWTTRAPMPTPRMYLGFAELNGILYAVGGHASGTFLATVEAYDPATNTWTTRAPLPTARNGLGLAVVNGILYAFGGYSPSGYVSRVDAYDTATNSWTPRAPMGVPRGYFASGVLHGVIYAAGGIGSPASGCNSASVCAIVEAYNPVTDAWATRASLATPRYATAGGVIGGLFYAAGGLYSPGAGTWDLSSVEAYHP